MAQVLIVEDNLIYRDLVHLLCRMDGHEVLDARDGEEALGLLEEAGAPRPIDLFIVDHGLGGLTGRDLIEKIRERLAFQDTPILLLSATARGLEGLSVRRRVEFLQKPMENREVVAAIRKLLPPWSPSLSGGGPFIGWT